MSERNPGVEALLAGAPFPVRESVAWLDRRRSEALERAHALVVPTTRDEDWRFTDLSALYKRSWQPVTQPGEPGDAALAASALPEAGARLVFVDGQFAPALSQLAAGSGGGTREANESIRVDGVFVGTLAAALRACPDAVEAHLARLAPVDQVFGAVSTAFLHDAAVIVAPRGAVASTPIHVLHLATRADAVRYARLLVVAERDSEVTVVEEYGADGDPEYFVNAVAEIAVAEGARVRHARVQREGARAFHIADAAVVLARNARYQAQSVALGAALSRYAPTLRLDGTGAECRVDGLALLGGRQLADTHSFVDHVAPDCASRQLHKCIVDGGSHAVFNGKIVVRAGAQRTDSAQQSRNLLLSARAQVDTKPQLEIFADDVKCAHGAAVGQLDAEQLFYLRSRGLGETAARNVLTYAFAAEVVARIPVASMRRRLEDQVLARTHIQELAR